MKRNILIKISKKPTTILPGAVALLCSAPSLFSCFPSFFLSHSLESVLSLAVHVDYPLLPQWCRCRLLPMAACLWRFYMAAVHSMESAICQYYYFSLPNVLLPPSYIYGSRLSCLLPKKNMFVALFLFSHEFCLFR